MGVVGCCGGVGPIKPFQGFKNSNIFVFSTTTTMSIFFLCGGGVRGLNNFECSSRWSRCGDVGVDLVGVCGGGDPQNTLRVFGDSIFFACLTPTTINVLFFFFLCRCLGTQVVE